MPDTSRSSRPAPANDPLTERVRNRLLLAGESFDRRRRASRPASRRRKLAVGVAAPLAGDDGRERACLRSVFRELGEAHRRYRTRTGVAGTPALRAAARAFKEAPSLGSLVPVAAHLDELGVLAW
jgi:hypothetical protein